MRVVGDLPVQGGSRAERNTGPGLGNPQMDTLQILDLFRDDTLLSPERRIREIAVHARRGRARVDFARGQ